MNVGLSHWACAESRGVARRCPDSAKISISIPRVDELTVRRGLPLKLDEKYPKAERCDTYGMFGVVMSMDCCMVLGGGGRRGRGVTGGGEEGGRGGVREEVGLDLTRMVSPCSNGKRFSHVNHKIHNVSASDPSIFRPASKQIISSFVFQRFCQLSVLLIRESRLVFFLLTLHAGRLLTLALT